MPVPLAEAAEVLHSHGCGHSVGPEHSLGVRIPCVAAGQVILAGSCSCNFEFFSLFDTDIHGWIHHRRVRRAAARLCGVCHFGHREYNVEREITALINRVNI